MRTCYLCVAFLCFIPAVDAQSYSATITDIEVGFQPYAKRTKNFRCKVGLWTPVYVTLTADEYGNRDLPQKIGDDGEPGTFLQVTTKDSDNLDTQYRVPISLGQYEHRTVVAYTKPGLTNTSVDVSVHFRGEQIAADSLPFVTQKLGQHYYLTLGPKLDGLNSALLEMAPKSDDGPATTAPRHAGFETSVARLPSVWFGYDAVDLMILSTSDAKFIQDLLADEARLSAIATWVRRGGRLLLSVHPENQQLVSALFENNVWSPELPNVLSAKAEAVAVERLYAVEQWAQLGRQQPFRAAKQIPVAQLSDDKTIPWRVSASTNEGRPLIAQIPYGRGAINVFAFDFHQTEFRNWPGSVDFFKTLINRLAPRVNLEREEDLQERVRFGGPQTTDLTTTIYDSLDDMDVPRVSFGWVAFFIVIYILVVGPLDYLLLKRLFKRLEWTWVTFPATVVFVGVVLVVIGNSLKGEERRINQVDIVDIDLRSGLDAEWRPKKAIAIGQTWFSVLSPRNENYTIGVQPHLQHWWGRPNDVKPESASPVSWLGRPEQYGPGAMSRAATLTLFRRPYRYAPEATGLMGTPIPVWSTKCFTASWETPLPKLPFNADLSFHLKKDLILSGAMTNQLPFDLEDVWVLYRSYCFSLPGPWKAGENRKIQLEFKDRQGMRNWPQREHKSTALDENGLRNVETIKLMLFHEDIDAGARKQNHMFRRLDLSWRLPIEQKGESDPYLRDAIVYARLAPRRGQASAVMADAKKPLPSRIWLGNLPARKRRMPEFSGTIQQETHLRFLIPVKPAGS